MNITAASARLHTYYIHAVLEGFLAACMHARIIIMPLVLHSGIILHWTIVYILDAPCMC